MFDKKVITANLIMIATILLLFLLLNKSCKTLKAKDLIEEEVLIKQDTLKSSFTYLKGKLSESFDLEQITFDSGKSEISEESTGKEELLKLAEKLKGAEFENFGVKIEGYTDDVGDEFMNLKLSRERAKSVAEFLTNEGQIELPRVKYSGLGANLPVMSNETNEGRAHNRRVELLFYNIKSSNESISTE